jgi:hypothetical protein
MSEGNGKDLAFDATMEAARKFDADLQAAESPMATLAAAYNNAPHPMVRNFINNRALEIMMTDLPKLQSIIMDGPVAKLEEAGTAPSIVGAFSASLDNQTEESLLGAGIDKRVTAAGLAVGAVIDTELSSLLGDAVYANRKALYDVVEAHAKLVRALSQVRLTDEQAEKVAAYDAAQNEASNDEQSDDGQSDSAT